MECLVSQVVVVSASRSCSSRYFRFRPLSHRCRSCVAPHPLRQYKHSGYRLQTLYHKVSYCSYIGGLPAPPVQYARAAHRGLCVVAVRLRPTPVTAVLRSRSPTVRDVCPLGDRFTHHDQADPPIPTICVIQHDHRVCI